MLRCSLLLALGLSGCVASDFADGQFTCDEADGERACPEGQSCVDGVCRGAGAGGAGGTAGTAGTGGSGGTCAPSTCDALAPDCGTLDDACGGTIACPCATGGAGGAGGSTCRPGMQARFPLSVESNAELVGGTPWQNPSNVEMDSAAAAIAVLDPETASERLDATQFPFDLPADAIVSRIVLRVERSRQGAFNIHDLHIRVLKLDVPGDDVPDTQTSWPTTPQYATYEGLDPLWGHGSWSVDELSQLKVRVRARNDGMVNAGEARVHRIETIVEWQCP